MIVSALVVTWHAVADTRCLPPEPRLTWGPRRAARQAVVSEAADTQEAEDLFHWLQEQEAVAGVDLVSARFDDDTPEDDARGVEEDHPCP